MNSFVETLNLWGGRFTGFALPMLLQSSLLIATLFLIDLALRRKVRAVVRYALWMLVLIKLVLPPSLSVPTGLAYWFPEKKMAGPATTHPSQFVVHYTDSSSTQALVSHAYDPPPPTLRPVAWLTLVWLTISAGLLVSLCRRSHRVAMSTRLTKPASSSPEQLLDSCRRLMRIRRCVRVKLSATASSPVVYGLWRPLILIPQQLADKLSVAQLRAVLLHEMAHVKRGDVCVHYVQTLLQIFYWWHPLLWLANRHIRCVREQAVDETVVVTLAHEAPSYPAALLEVAKFAFARPLLSLGFIGIMESRSALGRRIKRLVEQPAPKSAKLNLANAAAILLCAVLLLPMARGQQKGADNSAGIPATTSDQSTVVTVKVTLLAVPDASMEKLALGEAAILGTNGHRGWVLGADALTNVMRH